MKKTIFTEKTFADCMLTCATPNDTKPKIVTKLQNLLKFSSSKSFPLYSSLLVVSFPGSLGIRLTASWRQESTACQCVCTILSVHLLVYYTGLLSPTPVQEDLLNGDEDEEFIRKLAANIATPTLIAWGDHDQVLAMKLCVCMLH